jgi:hypothetical protein
VRGGFIMLRLLEQRVTVSTSGKLPGTVAKFFRSLREPDFERIGLLHAAADLSHAFPFIGSCPEQEPNCRDTVRFQVQSSFSSQLQCAREERCRASALIGNSAQLIPVRDRAAVLKPGALRRVSEEMRTGDVAVSSGPGTSQAGQVFFSHVSARAIEAVCRLMVDSLDLETLMSVIP